MTPMLQALRAAVRAGHSQNQACGDNDGHDVHDAFDLESALTELQERCKSVSLEIGGSWQWRPEQRKWVLKWEDHDASTGSIEHASLPTAVHECLRRVRLYQENPVGDQAIAPADAIVIS